VGVGTDGVSFFGFGAIAIARIVRIKEIDRTSEMSSNALPKTFSFPVLVPDACMSH